MSEQKWPKFVLAAYHSGKESIIEREEAAQLVDERTLGWLERGEIAASGPDEHQRYQSIRLYTLDDSICDAAPDLLAACKEFVASESDCDQREMSYCRVHDRRREDQFCSIGNALTRFRAVIDKAEGRKRQSRGKETLTMTTIDLRTGTWKVKVVEVEGCKMVCEIIDNNDEEVHRSESWEQTALHLAMAMDECRRLRAENRALRERVSGSLGPSGEHANFG